MLTQRGRALNYIVQHSHKTTTVLLFTIVKGASERETAARAEQNTPGVFTTAALRSVLQ